MLRSPANATLPADENLEIIAADARDAESLQGVLRPDDIIVSAIGPSGRKSGGLYAAVAQAVVKAGAHLTGLHFIGITSSGVRDDDPNHPWWYRTLMVPFMRETYTDMALMEATVEASALQWTFARPGRLLDETATGNYRVEDGINPPKGVAISRADLAEFVVKCGAQSQWVGAHPTITR